MLDYCNSHNIAPIKIIEDTVSGKIPWEDRKIGEILQSSKKGDLIIVAAVSRLGRSTLQVLEILEFAAKHEVAVHIAKNQFIMEIYAGDYSQSCCSNRSRVYVLENQRSIS